MSKLPLQEVHHSRTSLCSERHRTYEALFFSLFFLSLSLLCICSVFVLYLFCICSVFVLHLLCICSVFALFFSVILCTLLFSVLCIFGPKPENVEIFDPYISNSRFFATCELQFSKNLTLAILWLKLEL